MIWCFCLLLFSVWIHLRAWWLPGFTHTVTVGALVQQRRWFYGSLQRFVTPYYLQTLNCSLHFKCSPIACVNYLCLPVWPNFIFSLDALITLPKPEEELYEAQKLVLSINRSLSIPHLLCLSHIMRPIWLQQCYKQLWNMSYWSCVRITNVHPHCGLTY